MDKERVLALYLASFPIGAVEGVVYGVLLHHEVRRSRRRRVVNPRNPGLYISETLRLMLALGVLSFGVTLAVANWYVPAADMFVVALLCFVGILSGTSRSYARCRKHERY